ncbi:MAG: thymidylate synthase [Calditrichaeota bacterium]|nr:MAG: thymidylate synthase [Calditrichota bacterium]MBL1208002.1 thymidylate synthase [Calditrichota bacterium]NOG47838.1 thymidylate synthase [Calditrichota bacterium]
MNIFKRLLKKKDIVTASKGKFSELRGILLEIKRPRERISRSESRGKVFSCLGELLWYLSKTNKLKQIEYYIPRYKKFSDDGKIVYGAYGPRFFNMHNGINQIENIINILKTKPTTRQAVIQLFDAIDLVEKHKDVPCTSTLQFFIRNQKLHLITNMRSNDAFLGLPHDVFTFTMIQEIIASTLDYELGSYKHFVGSLHLYEKNFKKAEDFVDEGWHLSTPMPKMPQSNIWKEIKILLNAEEKIRTGKEVNIDNLKIDNYWKDLARLLRIFNLKNKKSAIEKIKEQMSTDVYIPYIENRQIQAKKAIEAEQLTFFKNNN